MKPGPRPTPTNTLKLRGSWRAGKRVDEPQPTPNVPTKPRWLGGEAAREWQRIAGELADLGLLTRIDRAALVLYCQAWADYVQAKGKAAEKGPVVKSPTGSPIHNPWHSIANKAFDQLRQMLSEFGLTPASRASVKAVAPREADTTGAGRFFSQKA